MRIAVDAMGGDRAPREVVRGAVAAAQDSGLAIALVGPEAVVRVELEAAGARDLPISIVPSASVVEMHEHPAQAVRAKKDSSIAVCARLVKEGQADGFVSAGNSGATMAAAVLVLGRVPGIDRPAIGSVIPTRSGRAFLLDVGANVDCKPDHLLQFALMGTIYSERVLGRARPRVGLLSIGEEATKGNQLVQATYPLLQASGLDFVGNVEGHHLTTGAADVVVTDGFVGNVALKVGEGAADLILSLLKETILSRPQYRLAGLVLRPALRQVLRRLDFAEYGGAPLLGINGVAIVAHGRSDARAVANAIRAARQMVESRMVEAIREGIATQGKEHGHG